MYFEKWIFSSTIIFLTVLQGSLPTISSIEVIEITSGSDLV